MGELSVYPAVSEVVPNYTRRRIALLINKIVATVNKGYLKWRDEEAKRDRKFYVQ